MTNSLRDEIISCLQDNKWYIRDGVWDEPANEILKLIENKIYELMGREDLKEPEDEIDFILLEARFRALEEVLELLKK